MEYGAIDLHTRRSQIRILACDGTIVLDRRIDTSRRAFAGIFESRPPMQVLLESSTEREWVAQHLESCGHQVIVADPNYAAMYGQRTRRIKTDRRDVAVLRAILRQRGLRLPSGTAATVDTRVQRLALDPALQAIVAP
jgi:transposase